MTGYTLALTCPRCGADVEHVNASRVIGGRETSAIVRCPECKPSVAEWQILVRLVLVADMGAGTAAPLALALCGTASGYRRHTRDHEPPCVPCKAAHAAEERARNATRARGRVGVLV